MRTFYLTITLSLLSIAMYAQEDFSYEEVYEFSAVKQHDIIIEPYYGYVGPGLFIRAIMLNKDFINEAGVPYNPQYSTFGPIGLRAQYMLSENFGLGVDVNYESKVATWNAAIYEGVDRYGNYIYTQAQGKYEITKLKLMIRTNWEFYKDDKFSMNWSNSLGYKLGNRYFYDPALDYTNNDVDFSSPLVPIAFRSSIGTRYYFNDFIGIHGEIGFFGGGWILAGLSIKIPTN